MGTLLQKLWVEEILPDYIRASLLTEPDQAIISSATSNYQRRPAIIVLLDHLYPLAGVTEVTIERGRELASNTASISLINMDCRYSGPNKHKLKANIPISIYTGYDGSYVQRYEGLIDTTTLTTTDKSSIINITCRDSAKLFIEQTISAGIYAETSTYLGVNDWHFRAEYKADGTLLKFPRRWKVSEIITDLLYVMGLRDIKERVSVSMTETPTGAYLYNRTVTFIPEFELNIDAAMDRDLVTNFVEECPLDCLGRVVQSIIHEVVFDTDGRLIVRPIKKASDPTVYYFKEERDIIIMSENTNDDSVVNVASVIGQTANETSIVYPFAPVAVKEDVTVSKGQDLYSESITYPAVVSKESIGELQKHMIYAPVIHPEGTEFEPINNPENNPQFDTRMRFPNFANGYKKQKVLEATCPIVTDEADWAPVGNRRLWNFYGDVEEAVSYERQPIILKDRFEEPVLVVCKERSVDDEKIIACGNTPYTGTAKPDDEDEDDDPQENIPTELFGWDVQIDGSGQMVRVELKNIPTEGFEPIYNGLPSLKSSMPDIDMILGWSTNAGGLPAQAPIPLGLTAADITQTYSIYSFTNFKADPAKPYDDIFSFNTLYAHMVFFKCTRTIDIVTYRNTGTGATLDVCISDLNKIGEYDTIEILPNFIRDPSPYVSGCTIGPSLQDQTGMWHITVPYTTTIPAGWIKTGTDRTEVITYPAVLYALAPGSFGGSGDWKFVTWDEQLKYNILLIEEGAANACQIKVAGGIVPMWFGIQGDPDTNCIYWAWYGGYNREDIGRTDVTFVPSENIDPILLDVGADWTGQPRMLIKKEDFYKFAADPNTVVIELVTAGLNHKSSAEVVKFNEQYIQTCGHNLYGSMAKEFKEMAEEIEKALEIIGAALLFLAISILKLNPSAPVKVGAWVVILLALGMIFVGIGAGNGRNVSKVMEDMNCTVHACRREEIHLNHNIMQAASWNIVSDMNYETGEWHKKEGTMEYMTFAYTEGDGSSTPAWVFIMDITKAGTSGLPFPDGAWLTSFGWETPEIGDRNLIDYYETNPVRKEMTISFNIEAFGDDTILGYSAEYLMRKRFTNLGGFGIPIEPGDDWVDSSGYEVLVDRSATTISVTDSGLWWDFFERRDNYRPRIYKYVAVVVYSATESLFGNPLHPTHAGSLISKTQHVVPGSTPNASVILSDKRFGFFVPRGLNAAWYSKYRWLEEKTQQNYVRFHVLYAGQSQLVAHIYNNFRYSEVHIDIRIWGKAYGKFAPTIVFYKETDQASIGSYGRREIRLVNNCINDPKIARYLANHLASMTTTVYKMEVTGKPYLKEGDLVMVKEETTGSIAGTFRTWQNTFKNPMTRPCTLPGNQLVLTNIPGILEPRCCTASIGNNVLAACGGPTTPTYLVELDKSSNPVWWAKTGGNATPTFVLRWESNQVETNIIAQSKTLVGLKENQTVSIIDYAEARSINRFFLPAQIQCGCLEDENRYLFVGTSSGVACIDLYTMAVIFHDSIGSVLGIAAANWKVWDKKYRESDYGNCGVVFILTASGIAAYQIFNENKTGLGPLLATYSGVPLQNPQSITYDKFIHELVYVNGATPGSNAGSIYGIEVDVNLDPDYPEAGVEVEFVQHFWALDYMNDAELIHQYPNSAARLAYINRFFAPVHAVRDIVRDLIITDTVHNNVYKVNPSGKFYVTKITDAFTRSNESDEYRMQIEAVPVEAAMSLQLSNFGKNYIQQKTDEQIEGQASISMGRIISVLPKGKYLIKLLCSDTVVEAYNNSTAGDLKIQDTVLLSYGYGDRGMCAIIAKKSLWDWVVETGDPYVTVDATQIDLSQYGQDAKDKTLSTTNTDLSVVMSRIRKLEQRILQLSAFHGITS